MTRVLRTIAIAAVLSLVAAASAGAAVKYRTSFGQSGTDAGKFQEPAGLAVDQSTGDLYVADRQNNRIQQFTGEGEFIRAWGYDVVASGEDDKPFQNEVQEVKIAAQSGSFRLSYEEQTTGGTAKADVSSGSSTLSNLVTVEAKGEAYEGSYYLPITTTFGDWRVGLPITGPGLQPGTTVTNVYFGTVEVSQPATETVSNVVFKSTGPAPFAVGQAIEGPGIPADTKIEAVAPGSVTLSNPATATAAGVIVDGSIPFDASAAQLKTILDGVPAIAAGGGSVSVSGGPGDSTGSHPYIVTFDGGPRAKSDVGELRLEGARLAQAPGTALTCEAKSRWAQAEGGTFEYRWLAGGQPISGANSSTYTPTAADAGKAVQCMSTVTFEQQNYPEHPKAFGVNGDYTLIAPTSGGEPPLGPEKIASPTTNAPLTIGGAGGQTVTCDAGSWSGSPTTYTYQWYMHDAPLGSPTTTSSPTNERTLTAVDVAAATLIQCQVTATNAAGSSTMFSDLLETNPAPTRAGLYNFLYPATSVEPSTLPPVVTTTNGGPVFEVCQAPPSNDVCKAGAPGPGLGQLRQPRGVAVDNSDAGSGDVYVGDDNNFRVQKFSADGDPILTWGGRVNHSTKANVCTAASGDACGVGVDQSESDAPGAFAGWPEDGFGLPTTEERDNSVAVDPTSGDVFVTDPFLDTFMPFRSRVQRFDPNGNFIGQVRTVGAFGQEAKVRGVTAGEEGNAFASFGGEQAAVGIYEPDEFTPAGTEQPFSERHVLHENQNPKNVAADISSDKIWITDRNQNDFNGSTHHVCSESDNTPRDALIAYDHLGHQLECFVPTGSGEMSKPIGLAISNDGTAYVSEQEQNKIKLYDLPEEKAPGVSGQAVSNITTETAKVHAVVDPGFEPTSYKLEYGAADCASNPCQSVEIGEDAYGSKGVPVLIPVENLKPGTRYHYRVVAENPLGTTEGPDRTFTSFPFVDLVNDPCENALARKQTRTAGLLDCRAYELASSDYTGGYDVVSDLDPGEPPLDLSPDADGKLLYSVRDGGIPGTGSPTNRGRDPYVATRTANGWTTQYVGIPADGGFSGAPFSSTLAGSDASLSTFAFAGPQICSPCFGDGSTGLPVHLPNGTLAQGMKGSIPQTGATAAGYVGKRLSADGTHLVFGTTSKLEPTGNENGDVTIYERNLAAGTTEVVSTLPNGATMTGAGIGELDLSADGSSVLIGQEVGSDTDGNKRWKLYLHHAGTAASVELTPGASQGALFGGMTEDASRVLLATKDSLLGEDSDESADVYMAEVDGSSADLKLLSTNGGSPSNDDSCEPVGSPNSWNAVSGDGRCDALVLAGGAGLASSDGSAYFLSPEQLDGSKGEAGSPNLYVVRDGSDPEFVATVDSPSVHAPEPPANHPVVKASFATGLSQPEAIAVDEGGDDVYVVEQGEGKVRRYTTAGAAHNFSAGPGAGTNAIPGQSFGSGFEAQVAFDNSASPLGGSLYVTTSGSTVNIFSTSGEGIGTLTGFGKACGVAVDPDGVVYVGDGEARKVWRFAPTGGTKPVSNADYTVTSVTLEEGLTPCRVAADGDGNVYVSSYFIRPLMALKASEFAAGSPLVHPAVLDNSVISGIAVDPDSGELLVDNLSKIAILDGDQQPLSEFGSSAISESLGIAVDGETKHAYASDGNHIVEFGIEAAAYEPIDLPLVRDAVEDNEVHRYGDFQVTPGGDYAIFATRVSLDPEYSNERFQMVYRYDAGAGSLACASCLSTEGVPSSDAFLPAHGLGLTDDGRVFFDSSDQLVMRDTNGKEDAYEWKGGVTALISTGFSAFPSDLLGVTRDGTDAYFFTREQIVPGDRNGEAMKLYDARVRGGFFALPSSPPCAASDECHGAGSTAAPPPPIGTFKGTGGQHQPVKGCKKPKVKRNGKCVKPKKKQKHHKRKGRGGNR